MIQKPSPIHDLWFIIKDTTASMSGLLAAVLIITALAFSSYLLMLAGIVIWLSGKSLRATMINEAMKEAYKETEDSDE